MTKYEPLYQFLLSYEGNAWSASFDDIEGILGFKLPRSAYVYQAWWANQRTSGVVGERIWMRVGWVTENLDLASRRVDFRKESSRRHLSVDSRKQNTTLDRDQKKRRPRVEPVSTEVPQHAVEGTLRFSWDYRGVLTLDNAGKLCFPEAKVLPGVYRFDVRRTVSNSTYVGESLNLKRRFQNYRTPGSTQLTNIRINELLVAALDEGAGVDVWTVTEPPTMTADGQIRLLSLENKEVRRLCENFTLVVENAMEIEQLNK